MNGDDVLATLVNGGLATVVLEYIGKPLLRFLIGLSNKYLHTNLPTEWSTGTYVVILAGLNVALVPFMAWLGWVAPITDPKEFVQRFTLAVVGALLGLGVYHGTIGRSKENIAWRDDVRKSEDELDGGKG